MVVLDVLKEYRRRGIAEMLILHTLDYGKNVLGYTGAELGWTLEDNDSGQPHDRGRRRPALQDLPAVRERSVAGSEVAGGRSTNGREAGFRRDHAVKVANGFGSVVLYVAHKCGRWVRIIEIVGIRLSQIQ